MKRMIFLICVLLLSLCFLGTAAAQSANVIDQADLFTPQEEMELAQLIDAFRSDTGMDFAIVTTQSAHAGSSQAEIADALYERGGYGTGDDKSGILYYIDMYERIPFLTTTGKMINYMTDDRVDAAHEASYPYLASGAYARAAQVMISSVQSYVRRGIPEGQFQYDSLTGERLTASYKVITSGELLLCLGIALVVALIYVSSVNHGYSLKGSTYEYAARENCELKLTGVRDDYLRTTTTRTRKVQQPPPTSGGRPMGGGRPAGGSGTRISGGGIRHGGGAGRKF